MRIAICDDSLREGRNLTGIIGQYAAERGVQLPVRCYSDPAQLLADARNERFTLYFLDVMMPGMNGIELAKLIRESDREARLVFLTSFQEYAYQSYRVKAYDYLLKPPQAEEIYRILDELRALEADAAESIPVQNGRSVFRVPFSALTYLEVNQKQLYFHLSDGQVRQIAGTMSEYQAELLARPEFVKIHRSYIANLNHVSVLSPEGCVMYTGENLPVSRLSYNRVQQAFLAHLFERKEG